jgi:hypothetical protein
LHIRRSPVVYASQPAKLLIGAKVFADIASEPFELEAHLNLEARQVRITLPELIPDWKFLCANMVLPLEDLTVEGAAGADHP